MILKTYTRIFSEDFQTSMTFLEHFLGKTADITAQFEELKIGAIGGYCVVAGTAEALAPYRHTYGPIIVDDLKNTEERLVRAGAVITLPISDAPTGTMLYARHPDGAHVEYVQFKEELVDRIIGKSVASN
jgi:predicted enzyme related to lactoylglutathione lyase